MDVAEQGDERDAFCCRVQVASLAEDIAFGEEAFDDLGAGGGCAEAAFAHRLAQVFILDELSCSFHGGEEGCFVVSGGRAGFERSNFDGVGSNAFALGDWAKVGIGFLFTVCSVGLGLLAVDLHPTWVDDDFSVGFERMAFDSGDSGGDLELGGREKDGNEALRDEVKDFEFAFVEVLWGGSGWNNGKVIADLCVIENAFVGANPSRGERLSSVGREDWAVDGLEDAARGCEVVFGKVAGVGSRVGEDFVLFVECLRDLKGHSSGEPEALVGFALESGEVVQQGCGLRGGLFFLFDSAGFTFAGSANGLCFLGIPNSFSFRILLTLSFCKRFVEPAALVRSSFCFEDGVDFEIGLCLECADFLFSLNEDSEGRGLDAAGGGFVKSAFCGVEGGEGAGAVDSDQPVGFGAAESGIGEWLKFEI